MFYAIWCGKCISIFKTSRVIDLNFTAEIIEYEKDFANKFTCLF
jgi:hypothetical protein